MFLIQSLTLFLTEKKLDDCSSSTLDFYGYTVGKLLGYMGEKYGEIGVERLQEHIQEYFLWLKEENSLSPHSYHSHLRGIKVYLNFLFSEGFIDSEIRVPKIRKLDSEIKPLSESDSRRVLNLFDLNSLPKRLSGFYVRPMAARPPRPFVVSTTFRSKPSIAGKRNTARWNWPTPNG